MPRAVVILPSTSYRAADFVSAADALGVDLVVASEQPPPIEMGDNYVEIDCSNTEHAAGQVVALGDQLPLDGIVAADDAGVVVGAIAGTRLGLPSNPPEAAAATRDKLMMRELLAATEVPQPRYRALQPGIPPARAGDAIGYPLVVKPRSRSASQGVIRAESPLDLDQAVERVRSIVGEETLLIEGYAPGAEVAVEGLVRDGQLDVLAIFDKPDMGEGPFFPETIMVTPSRLPEPVLTECTRVAEAAITALGLSHGPVHVELRADGTEVRVIEVAARSIGGLCSRSLNFGLLGTSLETLILRNALGMDKPELRREQAASGVLMIPTPHPGVLRAVEGETKTRTIPAITGIELTTPPGTRVEPPPEGSRYLGFVFARADHPETVEDALREAQNTLQVLVE